MNFLWLVLGKTYASLKLDPKSNVHFFSVALIVQFYRYWFYCCDVDSLEDAMEYANHERLIGL